MTHIKCDKCHMAMDRVFFTYKGRFKEESYTCEKCRTHKTREVEYDKDNVVISDEVSEC